ncbi:kinesin-like protein KIF16B isoform X2 [Nematostella vectensis]|uniref:kinesin-like protein KIF16B isoform X2 n=1 Tax=Nematostella vectensis TaxID=45351 RepID=UPI0020775B10|nr:kinesin-like protein KIF16B isoform X2 [Nematostella vectensis]
MASVKVAVRVRPLNKRERDMKANVCIHMEDKKTVITNFHAPGGGEDSKDFTFDHSYWSADSNDKHFASQEQVFDDLGTDVLGAAFEGYNACIFAYGQTGAGKSYSMMGMAEAEGLIPRICRGLYSRMKSCADDKTEFRTEVSYLEIYNEKVRDLLQPSKGKDHFNLKVREHPKEGPYVQDLTKHHVGDYEGIERLMDSGNSNRTVASTNMNDVSSRSHAIFTLSFTQAKFYTDMPSETVSKIHLVDLAGSERANSTGATGDRLKEGANINKSLVTLGTVISNLADASDAGDSKKDAKKKLFIPYRNSVLTWLLKDSLGGNAKTIMIAAISPADVNYSETLSTLRYANRAKNIINKPTVNEDANVKLIRELRSEIERLRTMLTNKGEGSLESLSIGEAEKNSINEQLHQNEAKVEELTKNWTSKWRETQKIIEERALGFRYEGSGVRMESELPHLVCIDDDVLSTGVTLYHLKEGMTYMGKEGDNSAPDIILTGPGIDGSHCIMECIDGNVIMHPLATEGCQINGEKVTKAKRLSQGDVVLLGKTNMFRYNHPQEAAKLRKQRYYESMENLAEIGTEPERTPSYLFYNAGLELERQYREETKLIEQQRSDLEQQQKEAARKLEEARLELEVLKAQQEKADQTRSQEEEERQREIQENKLQLEKQKKYLEELRIEQENARKRAEEEIKEVKERIKKEQEEERKRMEAEMQRLLALEEEHRKTVHQKEQEMVRVKEELEKKWLQERQQVEQQRQEVEVLQVEIENKRKEVEQVEQQIRLTAEHNSKTPSPGRLSPSHRHPRIPEDDDIEGSDEEAMGFAVGEKKKTHIEILRERMQALEAEYEEQRKTAQYEIATAKEAVRKAEQEALEGLRSLTTGKSAIEDQWQKVEEVQLKHKMIHDQQLAKMRDVREMLDQAEEAEEAVLIEKEKIIMERRAARHKVEEVRRKLEELEHEDKVVELTEEDFNKKKELLEWETREEIKDIREERRILNELYNKHQTALQKATQMVTETKTKLEKHLESEKFMLVPLRAKVESLVRNELGPLIVAEQEIERRCEEVDYESRERKKLIYKQRRRIALLERQHNQALQQAEKETLNEEEFEELENEREAERSLIRKEKVRLLELEKKHKEQQEVAELMIGEAVKDLEKHKSQVNQTLEHERKKLVDLESVHKETLEHIEHELEARTEMLHRVKDKVQKDKRQLAKLDVRQQRCAAKAAEELFMMADLLEKEMSDKGKTEELMKIKEHRKKLQDLDRQLRMAERKERGGRGEDDQNSCTLI